MKKTLSALLSLAMFLTLAPGLSWAEGGDRLTSIKENGKLVVVTSPDYPPYEFIDLEGNYVGADISFAQYIADRMGVQLEILELDFTGVLAAISAGKADLAIAGLTVAEERKESMDFSDFYHSEGNQAIVILKENAASLKSFEDFTGKKVAAQNGTTQEELVTDQLPNASLELITQVPEAVMMVLTKKVDGLALATVVASEYLDNYSDLMLCEEKFDVGYQGNVVAAPKGESALIEAVNDIIREVVEGNLYSAWHAEATELMQSLSE